MRIADKSLKAASGQLGVVVNNIISLRADADANSECVTQALIGQNIIAEGGLKDWYYVQTWDTYRSWIPGSAIRLLDEYSHRYASTGPVAVIRELWADVHEQPHERAIITTKATVTAELEVIDSDGDWVETRLPDMRIGFIRKADVKLVDKNMAQTIWLPSPEKIIESACRFIGVPYLWGGTSPFGLDCSGFVQLVHRIHGITLLRDAHMQAGDARCQIVERENVRAGDLVFFGRSKSPNVSGITHVGIAIDKKRFINSLGGAGVVISKLDDFSSIYWGARRMRFETLDAGGGAPEE